MLNMMFLMIPYGAVIAYSSILAQEKGLMEFLPYFYICLVVGMLASKLSTQKLIDAGSHRLCGGRHRLWNICRPLLSQAQARFPEAPPGKIPDPARSKKPPRDK